MAFQENNLIVLDRDCKLLKRYYYLLNNELSFPFPAVYREPIGITGDATHLVVVVGLCDPSEHPTEHGLLCRAVLHGKTIELPLVEVESQHRQFVF